MLGNIDTTAEAVNLLRQRGEPDAVARLMGELGVNDRTFPVLPRHTITISVTIGGNLGEEDARIRLQQQHVRRGHGVGKAGSVADTPFHLTGGK